MLRHCRRVPSVRLGVASAASCRSHTLHVVSYHQYHSGSSSPVPDAATAAASTSAATPTASGSPQTYLDYMDRAWNSKWFGTVDESAVAAASSAVATAPPSVFAETFLSLQHALGVEAGTLVYCAGASTRLATLFFSLYAERAGARMRLALPELRKPQDDFNRVYFNDLASAMEVQVAASVLKSQRRAVFGEYKTSNLKCIASLAMAPVIMTGLYQVSALCENAALDVGTSSFAWCSALTLPDPYFVLPLLTCAITLVNFELSVSKEIKTGWMRNVIWGARLGCLCVVPVVASFRAGVCLYLIGMNTAGLLQPLLLRSAAFRRWFGFPSDAELTDAAAAGAASPAPPSAGPHRRAAMKPHTSNASGTANGSMAASLRERVLAAVAPAGAGSSGDADAAERTKSDDVLQASMTVQFPYLSHLLNPQVNDHLELFARVPSKQSKPDFARRPTAAAAHREPSAPSASSAVAGHGSRYARGANPLMQETPLHRHPASSPSTTHDGGSATATAAAAAPGRHTTSKPKGSTFASSGWKSAQLSFDEQDFIPSYSNDAKSDPASAPAPSSRHK